MKCILCCWVINSILPMQILAPVYLTLQRGIFQKLPSSAAQESRDCCNLINLCPVSSEAEPVFWIGALSLCPSVCIYLYGSIHIYMVQHRYKPHHTNSNTTSTNGLILFPSWLIKEKHQWKLHRFLHSSFLWIPG